MVKTVQEPTLFTWIVRPTVIYGRHQSAEVEVNEDYCVSHGIEVVQRKSGGGCVYADEGSYIGVPNLRFDVADVNGDG